MNLKKLMTITPWHDKLATFDMQLKVHASYCQNWLSLRVESGFMSINFNSIEDMNAHQYLYESCRLSVWFAF